MTSKAFWSQPASISSSPKKMNTLSCFDQSKAAQVKWSVMMVAHSL